MYCQRPWPAVRAERPIQFERHRDIADVRVAPAKTADKADSPTITTITTRNDVGSASHPGSSRGYYAELTDAPARIDGRSVYERLGFGKSAATPSG